MFRLIQIHALFLLASSWSLEAMTRTLSTAATDQLDSGILSDPLYILFFLVGIALLPFLAITTTSFTKIVVVLSIARQAIGTAQTPPNVVVMSLAIMLTSFSMYPVFMEIYNFVDQETISRKKGEQALFDLAHAAKEPMRNYLSKHARPQDCELFLSLIKNRNAAEALDLSSTDFVIIAPAFLISELTLAFQIGFLLYLPFLVIDMTVANLLMALGMQMLSPTTISLPFKILLFVLVDGWRLLAEGLAKG